MIFMDYFMYYISIGTAFTFISDYLIRRTEGVEPLELNEIIVSILLWPIVLISAIKALF